MIRKVFILTLLATVSVLGSGAADAGCTVNVGSCSSTGNCAVNVGRCDSGARCMVTVGHCYEGDSRLIGW